VTLPSERDATIGVLPEVALGSVTPLGREQVGCELGEELPARFRRFLTLQPMRRPADLVPVPIVVACKGPAGRLDRMVPVGGVGAVDQLDEDLRARNPPEPLPVALPPDSGELLRPSFQRRRAQVTGASR